MNRVENSMESRDETIERFFLDPRDVRIQHMGCVFHSVRNILRHLGLPMVCVAMFSLLGGHMAAFQAIAWVQMIREYSKEASMAEAVDKTFSGDAPCPLCKSIAKEKQKEEKAPVAVKLGKKAEIFLFSESRTAPLPVESDFCYLPDALLAGPVRFDSPPRPVPRSADLLPV